MTDRIYYIDPGCRRFSAVVTAAFDLDGRPAVCLDRTAFYPTSGGQPFDLGRLGERQVVDVIDDDARVVHVLDGPLAPGTVVAGEIEWTRRTDHMQQHTGQHILSAAFERVTGNPTLSFHMGGDTCTIDLQHEVAAADVTRVEDAANQVVWQDDPVAIRFVSKDEAASLPLRKESRRDGTLRLIEIAGVDLSACGGTHVRRTGEVGSIVILHTERFKGGARVTFACGGRALASHRRLRTAVADSVRVLSVVPEELPSAIEKLQVEHRAQRKSLKALGEALATHEAVALLDGAQVTGTCRLVVRALDGYDMPTLKTMAAAMTKTPGVLVALFTTVEPTQVVVARASDTAGDAGALVRALVDAFGGKGGGSKDIAQAGGLAGDVRQMVWRAAGLLEDVALSSRPASQ